MKQYTGRERVMLAYSRQHADRIPTDIQGINIGPRILGFTRRQLATDPQKATEALIKSWEVVRPDIVTVGTISLPMAQAAGNECDFDEEGTLHAKTRILEDKSNLGKMSIPDPQKDNPLPFVLEVCERVGSALKDEAGVRGVVSLPWTVAVQMRGMEQLIYDTVDDPDFVHAVMRFCTDYTKMLGAFVVEAIGEGGVGLFTTDPAAGCSVISPKIYKEFVSPYHEEIVGYFKERGTLISFHICGYLDPIMEDIVSTGVDGVSIDERSSLKKMFETSRGRIVVIGNIAPMLFATGTKEDIEAFHGGSGKIWALYLTRINRKEWPQRHQDTKKNCLLCFSIPHPLVVAKRKSCLRGGGVVDYILTSCLGVLVSWWRKYFVG
jgi:MtaA/CmuA family methyltransferase